MSFFQYWTQPIDPPTQVWIAIGSALVVCGVLWIWLLVDVRRAEQSRVVSTPDGRFNVDQMRTQRIAELKTRQEAPTERITRLHAKSGSLAAASVGRFGQKRETL